MMGKLTKERLFEIFEEDGAKWEGDNALQGLNILSKFSGGEDVLVGADHDIIYSINIDDALKNGLDEDSAVQLRDLNWMLEVNCYFACFV